MTKQKKVISYFLKLVNPFYLVENKNNLSIMADY